MEKHIGIWKFYAKTILEYVFLLNYEALFGRNVYFTVSDYVMCIVECIKEVIEGALYR